jgi:hypothetical protein
MNADGAESDDWGISDVPWETLSHAYGPASDTPLHLKQLVGSEAKLQGQALEHLLGAVLHQGTIYPASAPAAVIVSRMLNDTRMASPVAHWTDMTTEPKTLRVSLLDFLAEFANSANYEPTAMTFEEMARPRDAMIERAIQGMWRGDFGEDLTDAVRVEAMDAYAARSVLEARRVLPEIAPRVFALMSSSDPQVRQSAANAATKFASAIHDAGLAATVLGALEAIALDMDGRDRAALVLSIGQLGGNPKRFLDDPDFLVRSCAALAPGLADDATATEVVLDALKRPDDIDQLAKDLPQFELRPRFSFVKAAIERIGSFEPPVARRAGRRSGRPRLHS